MKADTLKYKHNEAQSQKVLQNDHSWSKHQVSKPWVTTPQDGRFQVQFLVGSFLLSAFSSLGGKVRPECSADNSAVLVVPNVNVWMEAQHSIPL